MTIETIARPARAPRPAPITLTPSAEARIADLLARADAAYASARVAIQQPLGVAL